MAALVWFTTGVALWHFTVFLPDRFCHDARLYPSRDPEVQISDRLSGLSRLVVVRVRHGTRLTSYTQSFSGVREILDHSLLRSSSFVAIQIVATNSTGTPIKTARTPTTIMFLASGLVPGGVTVPAATATSGDLGHVQTDVE